MTAKQIATPNAKQVVVTMSYDIDSSTKTGFARVTQFHHCCKGNAQNLIDISTKIFYFNATIHLRWV